MDEPANLFGSITKKKQYDCLFFALFPGEEAAVKIANVSQQLRDEHGLRGKSLLNDRLHVTLHHLGDYADGLPPSLVSEVHEAASNFRASPFEVTFDRAMSFARTVENRPYVLRGNEHSDGGLADLMAFQKKFFLAMCRAGLQGPKSNVKFTPHVTMLYDRQMLEEQAIEPVTWVAQDFVLVHSLVGMTQHIHLGRWPLQT
jgi:2'-5' RNA ligase